MMIKCGDCIYCINQKRSDSNKARECHYNPPTVEGYPLVNIEREGCRMGEKFVQALAKAVAKPINLPSPPTEQVPPKRKPGRPLKK